jgi:hypothetical protein
MTLATLCDMFEEILGRPITFRVVSVDQYIAYHQPRDRMPPHPSGAEDFLKKWATTFKALEREESAAVDPLLEQLLGRKPTPMQETLTELFTSK